MWSIRNLKDHDVSYATAILRQVIKTIVSNIIMLYDGGAESGNLTNTKPFTLPSVSMKITYQIAITIMNVCPL